MYEFQSIDHFQMPGKAIVFAFAKEQIPAGMTNLQDLAGKQVLIDGKAYKVDRVDAHPVTENDASTIAEDFGLLAIPVD